MTYRIKTIGGCYYIYETPTNRLIYWSSYEDDIKQICRNLNAGGGFDGHTPAFF
jgi:hypothetical protein